MIREYSGVAGVLDDETRVLDVALAAEALQVAFPALAVGRIGEHEIELARREGVVGQRRVLGSADQVVGRLALALEEEIGLGDGVGLGVDLLTVEVGGDLLAARPGDLPKRLFGDGEHPAGSAGPVVKEVGAVGDAVGDGQEDQLGHELDRVARGPVLAGLLVVLLVEAPHQLLEDGTHAVVVQAGVLHGAVAVENRLGAQVDVRREEFLDQGAEGVGLGQPRDLVAELEVIEDLLHIGRETVEVGHEIGLELLLAGARAQVAQGEPRGVVEGLAGGLAQGLVLLDDTGAVECGLHVEDGLLGRLQHRVQAAQYGHGQDHVTVLAADVNVAEHVVGDAPGEVGDPVELRLVHSVPRWPPSVAKCRWDAPGVGARPALSEQIWSRIGVGPMVYSSAPPRTPLGVPGTLRVCPCPRLSPRAYGEATLPPMDARDKLAVAFHFEHVAFPAL